MNTHEYVRQLIPTRFAGEYSKYPCGQAEEIRLRLGKRPCVIFSGREQELCGGVVTEEDLLRTMEKATGASFHTAMDSISNGFISSRGLRIGICGTAVLHSGEIRGFRNISSLAIRIPCEHRGICDGIIQETYYQGYENTLIISPPGGGKTTALREMVRCLSNRGERIGVVDERGELAAADGGRTLFDLGEQSDVISLAPKKEAVMMLLRGMNPQTIAMDEITKTEDAETVKEIYGCGVRILASAHAASLEELKKRRIYAELLELGIFKWAVVISIHEGQRLYKAERLE